MKTLKNIGEKSLIKEIIKPLFNPNSSKYSIGDDCAVIELANEEVICLSTDRVPHDLVALNLGLINYFDLGYYLAVLNISDIVASGTNPCSLLLNLAFPSEFFVEDFESILHGIKSAADIYGVEIVGGDLSSCPVLSISATSVGKGLKSKLLFRKGSKNGDLIYCCDYIGLTSTAFNYFLIAKPKGMQLTTEEENILINQFRKPKVRIDIIKYLFDNFSRITAMDNTDGIGQTLSELSEINNLAYVLNEEALPIHSITYKVGDFLNLSPVNIALGPGADFQLIGTTDNKVSTSKNLKFIGEVRQGSGVFLKNISGEISKCVIQGWNYYDSNR